MSIENKKSDKRNKTHPVAWKNNARFHLLVLLPQFQKEIAKIREDFDIPLDGISDQNELKNWHEKFLQKSDRFSASRHFFDKLQKLRRNLEEKNITYPEYEKKKGDLQLSIPSNNFNHKITKLGNLFHLPHNFVDSPLYGLRFYVLQNKIIVPSRNYVIEPDPQSKRGAMRWISIKSYAPLSKEELAEANKMLKGMQNHYFPSEVMVPFRVRKQFERDLRTLENLAIKRTQKPVRRKQYKVGSYLSYLSTEKTTTGKGLGKWERKHRKDIFVSYDQPTSRQIAKKERVKNATIRKALERIQKTAKEFYGIDLTLRQ